MTAIEFNNISKIYRLGLVSTGTLSHDLKRWWTMNIRGKEDPYLTIGETNDRSTKGESEYVWALKDIDFKVEQGDVVGIIGKNGAGKSTLLKILSKVTAPTTGTIRARGRIGSLLEVGTGFHPEMTGRENIYMNGAILGMTKAEITKKLDEIVDFSGCERYIDTPVKRYSSGMMVRLGFAVAAHLDPEILVVDEVLAVGDAEFQKKAIGKMQDVSRGEGRTVLFVSHNMGAVRNLCRTGVLLDSGNMVCTGAIDDIVAKYMLNVPTTIKKSLIKIEECQRYPNLPLDVEFVSFQLLNKNNLLSSDDNIVLQIKVFGNKTKTKCRINCTITCGDFPVGSVITEDNFDIQSGEYKDLEFTILKPNLAKGQYSITMSVGTGDAYTGKKDFDAVRGFLSFEIDRSNNTHSNYYSEWPPSWGAICFRSNLKQLN